MKKNEVFRRFPRKGPLGELAEAIAAGTGSPEALADGPQLRAVLARAFPGLPAPAALEGCTDHPSLTARFGVPGLARDQGKVVFTPREEDLEVRVRMEVAGGSYRKETLLKLAAFLGEIEKALDPPSKMESASGVEKQER